MRCYPVADVAGYFSGRWSLARDIVDGAGHRIGGFTGWAEFVVEGEALRYREDGELTLGTHHGPARRELRYLPVGEGQAEVHFGHGGFFHDLDVRQGRWACEHPCGADVYRGEYLILDADSWRLKWTVAGPAKRHVIDSGFSRLS